MTCRTGNKKGRIESFCENCKAANTNVQDGEVHEEAAQHEAGLFLCESFLCEDGESRSATFQTNDGINGGRIPKRWVLLDSQLTADAFCNPDLLSNVH
jgi:hypothetical protein